ncbi:MAG TPA: cyclic nucleotide-binding domain-containing protein, partial [Solirubrobacteraceae bacterium]|nr:cyclic nucleotide-binding domain-containing protein [Solirubrobacteraceae bacterium]
MSAAPAPDERTRYSSRRVDQVELEAWPEFDEEARALLESAGDVIRPATGELLWDGGDAYDLYLVLEGGICLVDRRDDRVSFVVEAGDFVGELGMLMGQPAFLAGVAMAGTALLRVPIEELHRLMATSTGLSDVLLTAFDARRRLLTRLGEGGLILAGDDDRDMHRLQEFAERNHVPYRTVLRSDPAAWEELAAVCALPEAGSAVVTGQRRILT